MAIKFLDDPLVTEISDIDSLRASTKKLSLNYKHKPSYLNNISSRKRVDLILSDKQFQEDMFLFDSN